MKGKSVFSDQQDINEGYRKILCAMIKQTISHAMGREMSYLIGKNEKNREQKIAAEKAKAIAYIMGQDFEDHMLWLGLENYTSAIREMVDSGEYQQGLFVRKLTDEDIAEIRQDYLNGEKTRILAYKFGVTQKTIQNTVRDIRYMSFGWQEIEESRKVEMEAV